MKNLTQPLPPVPESIQRLVSIPLRGIGYEKQLICGESHGHFK